MNERIHGNSHVTNGVMNMLGSFTASGTTCITIRPVCTACLSQFSKGVRLHLGRPFSSGLGHLGRSVRGLFPAHSVMFSSFRGIVSSRGDAIASFHGTTLLTTVAVLFIALVKLVNCVGSRVRHHDGRVTVHGIGNTRTSSVLQLFSGSVF